MSFLSIKTPDNSSNFQVRYNKAESVGILTTPNCDTYFILDSGDYWYDMIQTSTPKVMKCSCKNDLFSAQFEYIKRTDHDDFKSVKLHFCCTKCSKEKTFKVNIKYSPTIQLFNEPLKLCMKPFLKYKLNHYNCFWDIGNEAVIKYVDYMCNTLKLYAICWFWDSNEKESIRKVDYFDCNKLTDLLSGATFYKSVFLEIHFTAEKLPINDFIETHDNIGVYLKHDFWRYQEIITLRKGAYMLYKGVWCEANTIKSCNEYILNDDIVQKSQKFNELTLSLKKWLTENFDTTRSENCFDIQLDPTDPTSTKLGSLKLP